MAPISSRSDRAQPTATLAAILSRLIRISVVATLLIPAQPVKGVERCKAEKIRAAKASRAIRAEWSIRESDRITGYFSQIAQRLIAAAGKSEEVWRIYVIRNLRANGFSIGNGYLYINEGALIEGRTESEFAAVIAHEIGHQIAGHYCPSTQKRSKASSIFNPFSKEERPERGKIEIGSITQRIDLQKEIEADRYAVDLLLRAHFDPHALLSVAKRFPNFTEAGDYRNEQRLAALREQLRNVPEIATPSSEKFHEIRTQLIEETS